MVSGAKEICNELWDRLSVAATPGVATRQPPPSGEGPATLPNVLFDLGRLFPEAGHQAVANDLRARAAMGREKYGTVLRAFNGRDSVMDAYQELIDHVMYVRQKLDEKYDEVLMGYYVRQLSALLEFQACFIAPGRTA